jgi:uncharacterized protein YqjF (DUF2071 family)
MLNYVIDRDLLPRHVPANTELDEFEGTTYVSVVGFQFLNTRVLGVSVPGHRNFEEVNLRLYVRHRAADGWRRGVVFVREFVPREAIARTARTLYGERYLAVPMEHNIERGEDGQPTSVEYDWSVDGHSNRLSVHVLGDPMPLVQGTHEEFIAEHYWGYVQRRDGSTSEYRVDHPSWRVWNGLQPELDCDVERLYGPEFAEALSSPPISAFLADGSAVTVYRGRSIGR